MSKALSMNTHGFVHCGLRRLGKRLLCGLVAATLVGPCCRMPDASAAVIAKPPVLHTPHKIATPIHHNPHLHLPVTRTAPRTKRRAVEVLRGHWYHPWSIIHHGWGTISGMVESGGARVDGASVHLAGRRGRRLRSRAARHATTSSAGGSFVMHHVRPGRYRVVASRAGAGKGFAHTHVGVGGIEHVAVAIR